MIIKKRFTRPSTFLTLQIYRGLWSRPQHQKFVTLGTNGYRSIAPVWNWMRYKQSTYVLHPPIRAIVLQDKWGLFFTSIVRLNYPISTWMEARGIIEIFKVAQFQMARTKNLAHSAFIYTHAQMLAHTHSHTPTRTLHGYTQALFLRLYILTHKHHTYTLF